MKIIIYIMSAMLLTFSISGPLWLAKSYPIRGTPMKVRVVTFIAFFVLAIFATMLPIDIYNGMGDKDHFFDETPQEVFTVEYAIMVILWKVLYWGLLCGSMIIIPYMKADLKSGIQDDDERRKKSIRYIAIKYLIFGVIG